ncbi:hypothetical protein [Polaribacter aquimarinus]|uniref:Uncharacterized protein n=1 Tax=Polaribacter aquimarinus TaxID=2100726 RepID=A0A2U2J9D8_9FLAO|nr:hypothetical protein [Polaribacter aquimarinus]PWG04953.1 hypothetical protein DIS07_10830 [Polaribacter aquimarinus]
MKPENLKSKRLNEVRCIWKRQREISKKLRNLGYKKLDKPIRNGWFKEIVITHKIELYKNKEAILEVYKKGKKMFWGRTKEEAQKQWLKYTSENLIYKDLPTLSKKQFNKLSTKAKSLCTPFYYRYHKKLKLRFYIRIPKGAYKIKYTRAYVTHSKIIDPLLLSEYALLNNQLLKRGYYEAEQKLCKYKDDWNLRVYKKEKLSTKRTLKNLKKYPITDIINEKYHGK